MAAVDRNLIRMALYEMLHVPDVPYRVAINEAVELAKEYGSTESRRFVNGVLGAFVRKLNLDKTQRKRG
jgi:N utilization substance protein B